MALSRNYTPMTFLDALRWANAAVTEADSRIAGSARPDDGRLAILRPAPGKAEKQNARAKRGRSNWGGEPDPRHLQGTAVAAAFRP